MPITVRHAERSDIPAIDELCNHLYGTVPGASSLLETALLCLSAVNEEAGLLVGFLCLHDGPTLRMGSGHTDEVSAMEWLHSAPVVQASPSSSAFVWVCACPPEYELETSPALMRHALATLSGLTRLLLVTSSTKDLGRGELGLAGLFARIALSPSHAAAGGNGAGAGGMATAVWEATREVVMPPLTIRRAKVEDHDDMLPVLERADARFPALAKLPESSRPEEAFALTRVVAGQDERNIVFVAHGTDDGHESAGGGRVSIAGGNAGSHSTSRRLVGFMVATSEVDTSALADAFDLHPFDNFLPPEVYDAQWEEARENVRTKKLNTLRAKLGQRATRRAASMNANASSDGAAGGESAGTGEVGPEGLASAGSGGVAAAGEEGAEPGAAGGARAEGEREEAQEEIDLRAAAEPLDEEVKAEMGVLFGGGGLEGPEGQQMEPTIFAVTMACIDPEFEAQTAEFLRHAFDAFPDKLYCVLTLPHDSPEPPLVSHFTRIPPLPGSAFPEVLYLFNRHALSEGFEVRLAQPGDAEGVSTLVSGMPSSDTIITLFQSAQGRGTAVVAAVGGEVVGLVTINPQVDVTLLESHFELSSLLHLPHHAPEWHGEIDMLCLNPIFSHRAADLLSGAHRILKKSVLYYALPPAQTPPDALGALLQVPPRHRPPPLPHAASADSPAPVDAEFALYLCSRRSCYAPRRGVNAQIVVVGASEAGLAALERLLLDTHLSFNYLTLLAPGGINVGGLAAQYTAAMLAKLGLDARVSIIDAEMVGLDRASRLLELSDGSQLPFDVLLVTCGLQEQTCNTLAESNPDLAGVVLSTPELAKDFTVGDATTMSRLLVYGDTLDAYHALATLEARGAGAKAFFVAPPGESDPLVAVLRECAEAAKLSLPQPLPLVVTEVALQDGDMRPLITLQEDLNEKKAPHPEDYARYEGQHVFEDQDETGRRWLRADLIVGCRPPEASRVIFLTLNSSSLVYDGGVVVDGSFRTNDPRIYAAGSIARLSRRVGAGVAFRHYNSAEVGAALGACVARALSPADGVQAAEAAAAEAAAPAPPIPLGLHAAKVVGCSVPGGQTFLFAGTPLAMAAPRLTPPVGGRVLATATELGVVRMVLDSRQTVHAIAYLGRLPMPMQRVAALVGLSSAYLDRLVARYDAGDVTDLTTLINGEAPLLQVLSHDYFLPFRHSLLANTLQSIATGARPQEALAAAQTAAVEWLRVHGPELPHLHLPPMPA